MWKCIAPVQIVRFAVLGLLLGLQTAVMAQCDPPAESPTTDCESAPLTCINGSCWSTDNNSDQGHSGFCGPNTLVHNPQYFVFVATDSIVQIDILINNCTSGVGLQAAIIDIDNDLGGCGDWVNDDVIDCDPNFNGSTSLVAQPLDSGEVYLLLIDGSNAATCEYEITYADGIFEPGLNGDLFGASGDDTACPGDTTFNISVTPPITGAHGYIWDFGPGGVYTTTGTTLQVGEAGWNGIPVDWDGTYTVCVLPFSGCDTGTVDVCHTFEVIPVDDGTAPPDTHCVETYEDVGVAWGQMTITSPGTYTQEFYTPEGCPHDSTKTFEPWPVAADGQIDTVICGLSLLYEGMTYNAAGSYDLFYDDGSIYGCDSSAVLNVDFASVTADPSFECDNSDFLISANMADLVPAGGNVTFVWTDEFNTVVSNDEDWMTQTAGSYTLEIIIEINGVQCVYPDNGLEWSVDIVLDDILPPPPNLVSVDTVVCSSELGVYEIDAGDPDIIEINWQVPSDALIIGGDGTNEISIDWQNSIGGIVCVSWLNDCGESDLVCFEVQVIPTAVPLFNIMSSPACVDEVVLVEFSGSASDLATYTWDFDGGNIISGGTGPGPHEVSWTSTGTKEIKLILSEPGCDPDSITLEVMIESIGTPVINCTSDVTSITFEWGSVAGSTGFQVNVLSGPGGTLVNDTTYEVTGLSSGQMVELEVIALGNGICPPSADTIVCSAVPCSEPAHTIIPADTSLCEDAGTFNFTLLVDGNPATGVWSGPGIVDANAGTFDPSVAGANPMHQISVAYDDGMCAFNWSATVEVLPIPTSSFTVDPTPLCEGSPVTVTYTGNADASATYNWDFDGGNVVSGSGQGPYMIEWATPGAKTISLTVVEDGCTSPQSTQMVQVDAELGVPMINCTSTTSSITFTWSDVAGADTYTVNVLSGPSGTQNGNSYEVTGLTPGVTVEIEVTASGPGTCPATSATLECVAMDCPTITIDISPRDTILCLYPSVSAFDMYVAIGGSSGSGTGTWSGNGITDANAGTFDPATAGPGTHAIRFDFTEDGCPFSDEVMVTVGDLPTAMISNTDVTLTCDNGGRLTLDGTMSSAPSGTPIYMWTTSDGVIQSDPARDTVQAGSAGTYQLLVTDPVTGCQDSTTITLVQDSDVPTADAGPDWELNCDLEVAELGGNSSSGPGIDYLWSTSDGRIISDPTQITVMVDMPGTYVLVVTDNNNGCEVTDQALVEQNVALPVIMTSADGILTCDNNDVLISADVQGGSGNYVYSWTTQDGTINGTTDAATATAISPGTYQVVVTDQDSYCADSATVDVMADSDVIQSLQTSSNNVSCFGDANGSVTISAVVGGSEPYDYAWSNGSDGTSLTNLGPGPVSVTVTDANGCSFEQSWTITEPPLVTADVGDDMQVANGDSVTITLSSNIDPGAMASIEWSGPFVPCSNCYTVSFIAETSGQIQSIITDSSGCVATASMQLQVVTERNVYTPNVFTPNGDGTNDMFTIFGKSLVAVDIMTIYDRWGNVVFSQTEFPPNNDQVGWDGTYNGEVMNPGVYVFYANVIHDDGFEEEIIGDITLIR